MLYLGIIYSESLWDLETIKNDLNRFSEKHTHTHKIDSLRRLKMLSCTDVELKWLLINKYCVNFKFLYYF